MEKLYITNLNDDRAIDAETILMSQGAVSIVRDGEGNAYSNVSVKTDRDFIPVPDLGISLTAGDEIYLDNQSHQKWTVRIGWYAVDGNPAIYGWYLESIPVGRVRSLYLKDLNSLTMVTSKTQTAVIGG